MSDHYPLPVELDGQVTKIVDLIAAPGSPSNAVHVIAQALGRAYNTGHRDGTSQHLRLSWNDERLEKKLAEKGARNGATMPELAEHDLARVIAEHRYAERDLAGNPDVADIDTCLPLARAVMAHIESFRSAASGAPAK